jgi:hypothetical protein
MKFCTLKNIKKTFSIKLSICLENMKFKSNDVKIFVNTLFYDNVNGYDLFRL